jgi:hypothetical protein
MSAGVVASSRAMRSTASPSLFLSSLLVAGLACDRGGDPQPVAQQEVKPTTPPATPPGAVDRR